MAFDPTWIEVPVLLNEEQLEAVIPALSRAKLGYATEEIAMPGRMAPTMQSLRLRRDQAEAATRVIADALELEDPDQAQPFTGECPSCGAKIENSWTCPSCDLDFHSRFERDDPMIVFVRENGGFR